MADCVVPQEYGSSINEKRSVGVKICSSLLEKIKYDLNIARIDNKTDMRYMINMDYSADLPINTMGRRIRTRLYFTSESHLHTMINVLRFAGEEDIRSPVSDEGADIINNTRELCYLTQIVFRLFEDTSRSMDDMVSWLEQRRTCSCNRNHSFRCIGLIVWHHCGLPHCMGLSSPSTLV
mmetsp:Transcript_4869/g.12791  ORF Transcript_4869/g.12791 Transcript_4869/m.12791 type:complete len:179 (-) Transcript_4869:1308-1844(-)